MKEIKCFIFDQDGTFYPEKSELTNILRDKTKKWIMDRLSLDKKEVDDLYKKLPKKPLGQVLWNRKRFKEPVEELMKELEKLKWE